VRGANGTTLQIRGVANKNMKLEFGGFEERKTIAMKEQLLKVELME